MQVNEHRWNSMNTNDNCWSQWQSININGYSMKINDKQWESIKSNGKWWQVMQSSERQWKVLETYKINERPYENQWASIQIDGNPWTATKSNNTCMEIDEQSMKLN